MCRELTSTAGFGPAGVGKRPADLAASEASQRAAAEMAFHRPRSRPPTTRAGNRRRPTAFTITEVIVASGLLAIAIVPILRALTTAHVTTTVIEHRTCSLMLAQAKLDEIRARSIYSYSSSFAEANLSVDGPYLCTVADTSGGADLRTIVVAVGYDVNGNNVLDADEVQVTLPTLIAKRWL